MTAVTFPLHPPRLAFTICGRGWQNDVYENKVKCVPLLIFNAIICLPLMAFQWHNQQPLKELK